MGFRRFSSLETSRVVRELGLGLDPVRIDLHFAGALDKRGGPYRDGKRSDEKSQEFATLSVIEPISLALSKLKA